VTIIPLFILSDPSAGMNSYQALIVRACSAPSPTFLLRQFFLTIPRDLEEAAFMTEPTISRFSGRLCYARSPKSTTRLLASLSVFGFHGSVEYRISGPCLSPESREIMTIPVGLATLQGSNQSLTEWNLGHGKGP